MITIESMYKELVEERKVALFSRYLYTLGIYKHPRSFESVIRVQASPIRVNKIPETMLDKHAKILEIYNDWRNNNDRATTAKKNN